MCLCILPTPNPTLAANKTFCPLRYSAIQTSPYALQHLSQTSVICYVTFLLSFSFMRIWVLRDGLC